IGLEIRTRFYQLPATTQRITRINAQYGLHLEVLAPFEELEKPHAIRGMVAPCRWVRGPVDQWAYRLSPIEARVDAVALEVVAARKAEERRTHRREFLHDVNAIPVRAVVIRGRK